MYKTYTMYMEDDSRVFTVTEFRKRLREILSLVDAQKDIFIEKYGQRYVIIPESYYLELLKPQPEELENTPEVETFSRLCPRHHVPENLCTHKH